MKTKKLFEQAKLFSAVLLSGLGRTIYGAFIAGLLVVAVYGFLLIKRESGYAAVFDFIASISVLLVAICNMYLLGKKRKGGKK